MGQNQSKYELVYQQVSYGNAEGIKTLCREGTSLEVMPKQSIWRLNSFGGTICSILGAATQQGRTVAESSGGTTTIGGVAKLLRKRSFLRSSYFDLRLSSTA
ncbi:unnamed protein product [Linum trigynum]|uniref:Uncharacterized protein n=1 Tax=Linum trigynum TaxID=586398 RepID=A0AAV2G7I2_9ROSI